MKIIKSLFGKMLESVKKSLNIFPVTNFIIFVITLIVTFFIIGAYESNELIEHILIVCGITIFGTWLTESIFKNKKNVKCIILYIISFVIAIVFDRLFNNFKNSDENLAIIARWLAEYLIVCFFVTVYILAKKSNLKFEKYSLNLFLKLNELSVTFLLVILGFAFIYVIFVVLILDTLGYEIFLKMICLFTGFYYFPVLLNSFEGKEAEDTKFNKFIFKNILLPLLFVSMIIIYIYIGKLFFKSVLPNNHLFFILSVIFTFAFPIYVINKNYKEDNSFSSKINAIIPYLYIPFIFLQIYAIYLRANEYGLTIPRYMAIVLIVFEVIAIIFSIYQKSKYLREIVLVAVGISVVVMISPFNFEEIPMLSQKSIVDRYVESNVDFDSLSKEDKLKFAGAYKYIKYNQKYVNSKLTQVEKEKLSSYSTYDYFGNYYEEEIVNEVYFSFHKKLDNVNISYYSRIYEVSDSSSYSRTKFIFYNNGIKIDVDLNKYLNKIIEANEISQVTAERVFEENRFVKIDEDKDFYITNLSGKYNRKNSNVEYYRVEGYILQK